MLMGYFWDQDDSPALTLIRRHMRGPSQTKRVFREGLAKIISDPNFDCARFVSQCANRKADTREEGRAWLRRLQRKLFGARKKAAPSPAKKRKRRPAP
jgi:hypothetical protein